MNNDGRSKLGNKIRQAREARGWTQAELGKMLKYRYGNFVGIIESGKAEIPLEKIPLLSEILGFDPKELLKEVMSIRYPEVAKYLS
jgi:transcriptional regulator with XRE-family HTH domain